MSASGSSPVPRQCLLETVHYQQQRHWDCGVSCVIMAMPSHQQRNDLISRLDDIIAEEAFGQSTWTIDLCYMLKRRQISFLYTTTTLGVDPNHGSQTFYSSVMQLDTKRVTERFQNAKENDIRVEERSVFMDEILMHLSSPTGGPVIVLVNSNALQCDAGHISLFCGRSTAQRLTQCLTRRCVNTYHGHYLLVIGYDLKEDLIYYRNPTFKDRVCEMSVACFEEARSSTGTDEDLIFIYWDNQSKQ